MEAKCNCGAVKVRVDDDELFSKRRGHICHCENCRRTSGSTYGANLIIEKSKVHITGEENLTLYKDGDSLSGNIVRRYFCKSCGNPIKSETKPADDGGNVILKLGIFGKLPAPEMETFVDQKIDWVTLQPGTTRYKLQAGKETVDPGRLT